MAEPLKNQYGPEIPAKIAGMVAGAWPAFDREGFLRDALDGYEALELLPRGRHVARALRRHLPDDYREAVEVLLASLGPTLETAESFGMGPFLYLPHTELVAAYGLDHFDVSLRALYELTQRFTAEFAIRPFLERYPEATLARLREWASDPSQHVRRLVSEGTRPRLPWGTRLRDFQRDPTPVLELLELLKDDPELYVRRSVANNLNDIGKDHPETLALTALRWLSDPDATEGRRWLVRHALRSAVKRGERGALEVLGYGASARVTVGEVTITPASVRVGESVTVAFALTNDTGEPCRVLADLRVHFRKARGKTGPKVFKLKTLTLAPGETAALRKTVSLAEQTTRKPYPGEHAVEVLLNGEPAPLGSFAVTAGGTIIAKSEPDAPTPDAGEQP
jgi:3-methyladenine DNA glycosylase AlkC